VAYSSEIEKLEKRWLENPKGRNFAPLADAYRKAGEVDRAIELCLSGLERHPDYVSAHIVYGRCLIDQKNDVGAETVFKKVLGLDAENIIALKVLGELAERGSRFDEQVDWLTRLLAADPMNDDARETLREARTKAAAAKAATPVEPEKIEIIHESERAAPAAPAAAPIAATPTPATPAPEEPGLIDLESLPVAEAPTTAMEQPSFAGEPPLVEHEEVELKSGGPRHSAIETFDDLSFTSMAAGAGATPGTDAVPEAMRIEGLARTQYEGSGMFRLDSPEEPPAADAEQVDVAPAADLPLIMPDDIPPPRRSSVSQRAPAEVPPEPPRAPRRSSGATPAPAAVTLSDDDGAADAASLQAAEPVVTETMAELYLRQGHREDALRVYRALLADRPGDKGLAAKVRELEGPSSPAPLSRKPPLESATAFLRRVWRGEPAPVPPAEPVGALETAFAAAPRVTDAVGGDNGAEAPGAPTQPAEDVISLDAVFGDQVGRAAGSELPPPAPPPSSEAAERPASGGFSFDDFFGATPNAAAAPASPRAPRATRPSRPQPEDEDLDQFQAWLKGLKA
jgi:tetratricopeptide (TPR) repeat protein